LSEHVRSQVDYAKIKDIANPGKDMQHASETAGLPELSVADKLNAEAKRCLTLIAKNDENAMADFYDATLGKVYAVALHIVGSPEAAEEVIEDVYMQVWRDAGKYDQERARVMTWLQTICRSRSLDYLRRSEKADTHPEPESLNKEVQTYGDDPADLLLVTEQESAVNAALKDLSSVQRQLVALAFFKGMSHQQISDHIEMPLGTVKTHIRKAIVCLQQSPGMDDERFSL